MPGPELAVRPSAAVRGADRGTDGGDLVLCLEGLDAEVLVARELVQDVARRGDRVAAVDELAVGQLRGSHETERGRLVARDVAVRARLELGRRDAVRRVEHLGRLAEGVAGLQRALVRLGDDGFGAEALIDPAQRWIHAPLVEPEHQAQGEEVLGQVDLLGGHVEAFERARVERADRDLEDGVLLERAVVERVRLVARLLQVAGVERVAVDDQRAARRQVADVRLERGRVHGHEHVRLVAGRVDLRRREADLEAGHAGQGAGRGADLGRVVGQRADVVAEDCGRARELRAGQLHAIARVARETDGYPFELLDGDVLVWRCLCGHVAVKPPQVGPSAGAAVAVG